MRDSIDDTGRYTHGFLTYTLAPGVAGSSERETFSRECCSLVQPVEYFYSQFELSPRVFFSSAKGCEHLTLIFTLNDF